MLRVSRPPLAPAADLAADNLHVSATLSLGQASSAVSPALDFPALAFHADSLAGVTFGTQTLVGDSATWEWLHYSGAGNAASRRVLALAHEGKLSLFNAANATTPALVLDASDSADVHITVAGERVLTEESLQQNFITLLSDAFNDPYSGSNLAIGFGTSATGSSGGLALGAGAYASGYNNSMALGASASASGYYNSTALGAYASASGNYYSTAIGTYASASGYSNSTALGAYASASSDNTTAIGAYASATTGSAIAIGDSAESGNYYSLALGAHTHAAEFNSAALGSYASTYGAYSVALGYYAQTGNNMSSGTADYATAIGPYASGTGSYSVALGYQARTSDSASESLAIGYNVITDSPRQVALGAYNDPRPELAFMIGNGQTGNWGYDSNGNWRDLGRSNLFAITTSGSVQIFHTPASATSSSEQATPVIELNPDSADPHITINGYRVLTEQNGGYGGGRLLF